MTEPPVRLLDDPGADAALRDALRTLAEAPCAYDAAAGLAKLEQTIGAPPPPPASPPAAPVSLGAKLAAAVGAAAATGALGWVLSASRAPQPAAPIASPVVVSAAAAQADPPPASSVPIVSLDDLPSASDAPSRAAAAPAASTREQLLAEEVRQLAELRRLAGSDPLRAARMADEGHQRFRGGMLYPEREALAVLSLSKAGRASEAQRRASAFLKSFPRNPAAEQLRAIAKEK